MNIWVEFFVTGVLWLSAFFVIQATSNLVTMIREDRENNLRREADERAEKMKNDIIESLNEKRE
jgi:hypothetical protein